MSGVPALTIPPDIVDANVDHKSHTLHDLFGKRIHELATEFPGQIPPPIQQITRFLRTLDSFSEMPKLFCSYSLKEKTFSSDVRNHAINCLSRNKIDFDEYLDNQDKLTQCVFSNPKLGYLNDANIASLFAQTMGEYLCAIPGSLITRKTSEAIAKKAREALMNAELDNLPSDPGEIADMFEQIIRDGQSELNVKTLHYIIRFLHDHIFAAAMFGSVTPVDIAESIYGWIFDTTMNPDSSQMSLDDLNEVTKADNGAGEVAEGFTLALAVLIENAYRFKDSVISNDDTHPHNKNAINVGINSGLQEQDMLNNASITSFSGLPGGYSKQPDNIQTQSYPSEPAADNNDFTEFENSEPLERGGKEFLPEAVDDHEEAVVVGTLGSDNMSKPSGNAPPLTLTEQYEPFVDLTESKSNMKAETSPQFQAYDNFTSVEESASSFCNVVQNLSLSAVALSDVCQEATNQASRLVKALRFSQDLLHNTRVKVISESQNLVKALHKSRGDSVEQLKQMNEMLQCTQLQLMNENSYTQKTLLELCNPNLLGLTKQHHMMSELTATMELAKSHVSRCVVGLRQKLQKASPTLTAFSSPEIKQMRAEIVRLRHALQIQDRQRSAHAKDPDSLEDLLRYRRENADLHVINDLKRQLAAARAEHQSTSSKNRLRSHGLSFPERAFDSLKSEVDRLKESEKMHIIEISNLKANYSSALTEVNQLKKTMSSDMERFSSRYTKKCGEVSLIRKQYSILQAANSELKSLLKKHSIRKQNETTHSLNTDKDSVEIDKLSLEDVKNLLAETKVRAAIAEENAQMARNEASAIRKQYLDRIVDGHSEMNQLLRSRTQSGKKAFYSTATNLLARLLFSLLHITPLRKAYHRWLGFTHAKNRDSKYRSIEKAFVELRAQTLYLSRALRASETSNRALESRLISIQHPSSRNNAKSLKSVFAGYKQEIRIRMLESELRACKSKNRKLLTLDNRLTKNDLSLETSHTRPETKFARVEPPQRNNVASKSLVSIHSNNDEGANNATSLIYQKESYEERKKRSADFLGFGITRASSITSTTNTDAHLEPKGNLDSHSGQNFEITKSFHPLNDSLDPTLKRPTNVKHKQVPNNRHADSAKKWRKKVRQRRRKSLSVQKVV